MLTVCAGWATHAFIRIMEENAFQLNDDEIDDLRDRTAPDEESGSGRADHHNNPRINNKLEF